MKDQFNPFAKTFLRALFMTVLLIISATTVSAYASTTGKWKDIAALPEKASDTAIQVDSNHVLVLGNSKKAFLYNVSKNKWQTLTNRTISGGTDIIGLNSSKYLIVGGNAYNSKSDTTFYTRCEIYNPKDNSFKGIASIPDKITSNVTVRLSKSGDIFAYGQIAADRTTRYTVNYEYKYDAENNTWQQTQELDSFGEINLTNSNGDMLLANADTGLLYSNASGGYSITSTMPAVREAATGITLSDGKFMIIGGRKQVEFPAEHDSAIYDPGRNIWMKTAQMKEARCNAGAAVLKDGRVFVAGGAYYVPEKGYYFPRKVDIYNPVTDQWSAGPSHKYYYFNPAMVLLKNGNIMLIGGSNKMDNIKSVKCELFTLTSSIKDTKNISYLNNSVLLSVGCKNYIRKDALNPVESTAATAPISIKGTTMIPAELLNSAFGASSTSLSANSCSVKVCNKTLDFTVGNKTIKIDGKAYSLNTAPSLINKIVYLPLGDVMHLLNKRVTSYDKLIVISDHPLYMDKLDAYKYLTRLDPDFKLGISKYGTILSDKKLYTVGDNEYRLITIKEKERSHFYINEELSFEEALNSKNSYTYQCLVKENKKSKEFEILTQGLGIHYLHNTDQGFYYVNNGYLAYMDAQTGVSSFVRSGEAIDATVNTRDMMSTFTWHPNSRIYVGNSIQKDGWIYFIWAYDAHEISYENIGYPVRVKYDGTELELLSIKPIAEKYSYSELSDMHIIGDYIYYRNLTFNTSSDSGYNLVRLAVDGSTQKIITNADSYSFVDNKIVYYRNSVKSGKDILKFSVYDPAKDKVIKTLSLTDAAGTVANNFMVAYTRYTDKLLYVANIMTGETRKFKQYQISQKNYPNCEMNFTITDINNKYIYVAIDIFNIKTLDNIHKPLKLNLSTGKYEKR